MAENSAIEWTHHTANTWWGCAKVSEGCKNCYAEGEAARRGVAVWGHKAPRRIAKGVWNDVKKWAVAAANAGERQRVFWGSMMDVCEDRPDLVEPRKRFCGIIEELEDYLDFLILTKRPENFIPLMPWGAGDWPRNAWAMTSVENQKAAVKRVHELLRVRSLVHGLSCEPLLERVDLRAIDCSGTMHESILNAIDGIVYYDGEMIPADGKIDWVIAGGESGPAARPMHPDWVRKLRDDCMLGGTSFFFKQWGNWTPGENVQGEGTYRVQTYYNGKWNDDADDWVSEQDNGPLMYHVGKKAAGRMLDGREWSEFPEVAGGK